MFYLSKILKISISPTELLHMYFNSFLLNDQALLFYNGSGSLQFNAKNSLGVKCDSIPIEKMKWQQCDKDVVCRMLNVLN